MSHYCTSTVVELVRIRDSTPQFLTMGPWVVTGGVRVVDLEKRLVYGCACRGVVVATARVARPRAAIFNQQIRTHTLST